MTQNNKLKKEKKKKSHLQTKKKKSLNVFNTKSFFIIR